MITLINSDARYLPLADQSVHCAITSPPYWGLRSYGVDPGVWGGDLDCVHEWVEAFPPSVPKRGNKPGDYSTSSLTNPERQDQVSRGTQSGQWCHRCGAWRGCLGLEPTPDLYVEHIVACMREVWRVLRPEGTLWLVIGDSYAGSWGNSGSRPELDGKTQNQRPKNVDYFSRGGWDNRRERPASSYKLPGLKPKDLCMIPARVALALQADGWYLRSDIIWSKPNPMPESVTDRPTKAHEYVFLLSKAERYYYDSEAIKEPVAASSITRINQETFTQQTGGQKDYGTTGINTNRSARRALENFAARRRGGGNFSRKYAEQQPEHGGMQLERGDYSNGRNKRSVWTIATKSYSGAHFAVFPEDLIEPMVLAGTSARGCCPACAAPWVRVIERESNWQERRAAGAWAGNVGVADNYQNNVHGVGMTHDLGGGIIHQLGWRPSCDCGTGDPIPCTVLDPFSGTATVGRVCARHGRRFVGGELNREYIALAHERTSGVQMELDA